MAFQKTSKTRLELKQKKSKLEGDGPTFLENRKNLYEYL